MVLRRLVELDERPAWMNSWLAEMFVDWMRGGDPVPTHIDDNIRCSAMLFAAIESAHTGQRVAVEPYVDLIAAPAVGLDRPPRTSGCQDS